MYKLIATSYDFKQVEYFTDFTSITSAYSKASQLWFFQNTKYRSFNFEVIKQ